jgi:predicted dehydrogenase
MLRLGIVGWGYWGKNYGKYLSNAGIDAKLEYVCDLRKEMLKKAQQLFPHIQITDKIQDLVDAKLDGVIIATPAATHYKIANYFLENKINVLVEKPFATSLGDAKKLASLSKKMGTKLLVGHTFMYSQPVRWIKKKIDEGYFGEINYLEFNRKGGIVRNDVNVVWDLAPHDLSMLSWFMGDVHPLSISAKGKKNSNNCQEDVATITLEYPNDILININVAWTYPVKTRTFTLVGSEKMLVFDDTNLSTPIKVYSPDGKIICPNIKRIDPLHVELSHFVDCVNGKGKALTGPEQGIENVMLLDSITKSLQSGKAI